MLEVIRCVLLCMLEGVGGGGGDTVCATLYAGGSGGWALFVGGAGGDALCARHSVCWRMWRVGSVCWRCWK